MGTGCSALVGKSEDTKLALKNPRDDDGDSDSDDGCDGEELLAAAEEGRGADVVLSILEKNPGLIRTGDPVGNTVLHMAARDGDIGTVRSLIAFVEGREEKDLKKVFMDVNVDGDTALHLALKSRHREVAYHLIKANNWTRNICNNDGIYPYEMAKEAGFSEVCELAHEHPYRFYAKGDVEMGAVNQDLMVASRNVHAQWIELKKAINMGEEDVLITGLMRDGKELLWHRDTWRGTLLHVAVTARGMGLFRKLVQFMISNGLTDAALLGDKYGRTALHRATEYGAFSKAICLIKAEPRAVYQVNHFGESPLYLAVKLRHEDLVKYMLTQSCLPACTSEMLQHPKHATLPHLAIRARLFGTLKLLLKHIPELVKGTDEKGWRPLSYAANKGYLDGVTYVLTNFPESAEIRDKDGSFPIHKAVGGGHVSIVKAFYELCPQSLHHVDRKGRNVVHIAVSYDRAYMFTYLTKELKLENIKLTLKNPRDDDDNSDSDDGCDGAELLAAAEEGLRADVLSVLEKNPGLIRTGDPVGNTVLHMAARDGDIGTVCNLIEFLEERKDEDLKMVFTDVNVDGDTALHLALKNRHGEVAHHLVKAVIWTRNICNNDGIYPFELAKEAGISEVCEFTISKVVELSAHADLEITAVQMDLMGASRSVLVRWNELHSAIEKGDEDVLITGLKRDTKELLWHQGALGQRLLHVAVTADEMGMFRKLVQFVINKGLTDAALLGDRNGNTALHRATQYGAFSKAICLIKVEPRTVYQVNHCGKSPLYLAVKLRHEDLVEHMVTQSYHPRESEMLRHPKQATLARLAIKARSFGILKLLLKNLPELVKGEDKRGWRPLSYAANKGYLDEVTYILTNFPKSAEELDNDGSFPIHKAVGGGHVSIVKAFYELCPQTLHHIDRKGRSVLHIAASYDRADILTYLTNELKLDDSLSNRRDNVGKTFMDYAKELKN